MEEMDHLQCLQQLELLKQRMAGERPASWESLPDLPLYMDQVVAYLSRQLITFHEGEGLTPAMINNYIKDGIVPRTNGKRYEREHLASLTAVAALKQVLSVRDIRKLLAVQSMGGDPMVSYGRFCAELDLALNGTLAAMEDISNPTDLPALAVSLALRSYAGALACRRILDLLRIEETQEEKNRKKKK